MAGDMRSSNGQSEQQKGKSVRISSDAQEKMKRRDHPPFPPGQISLREVQLEFSILYDRIFLPAHRQCKVDVLGGIQDARVVVHF